ncbi:MAG: 3-deoxy-8-phosphooctulonate synthase [Thermoguttaceae bacterium]
MTISKTVALSSIPPLSGPPLLIGNTLPLVCLAGPCVLESRAHALEMAIALKEIFQQHSIPLIFKASFDKANRTSLLGFRGPGMNEGLSILADIREQVQLPVVTDVHSPEQCVHVAEVVDVLQIPAFLCRQTDMIQAAALTGKVVNIKKGQFLSPWEMSSVLSKACSTGNDSILLCERGTSFGYGNLIVDMRSLEIMKQTRHPVVFDATHAVQLPGAKGHASDGQREFVPVLIRAAVAVGIAALFMEVHHDPDKAPCDGPNMLPLAALTDLLHEIKALDEIAKNRKDELAKNRKDVIVKNQNEILQGFQQQHAGEQGQVGEQHLQQQGGRLQEQAEKSKKAVLRQTRLVITDVDGVLTDGGLYYGKDGECMKRFHARDGKAIRLLQEANIQVAVLSGRDSPALQHRLNELNIRLIEVGQEEKRDACLRLIQKAGVPASQTIFLGDDVQDIAGFRCCGLGIAVNDAAEVVKREAAITLKTEGGQGVLCELADLLLGR